MTLIDEIVEVTIRHTTNPVSRKGLNTLLILGNSKKQHRLKTYSSIGEVKTDYEITTPEYKAAMLALSQSGRPAKIMIGQVKDAETFADAYNAIVLENNDFYGVMITSKNPDDQLAISALVETSEKIYGLSTDDKHALISNNEENILHKLHELKRERTYVIYHGEGDKNYIEAAWFGLMFSYEAGSASWAYKALSGVVADGLTANDRTAINSKNGNYFTRFGINNIVFEGKSAGGKWLDAVQGIDWLNNILKTSIANAFAQASKIPYTIDGLAIIENTLRYALSEAASRTIIDKESIEIFLPQINDIAPDIRNSRMLPDVRFNARLTGALHRIKINGTITV